MTLLDDMSSDELRDFGRGLARMSDKAIAAVGLDPDRAAWILAQCPAFYADCPDDRAGLERLLARLFRDVWFKDTCGEN
jgi:hypothetical protein